MPWPIHYLNFSILWDDTYDGEGTWGIDGGVKKPGAKPGMVGTWPCVIACNPYDNHWFMRLNMAALYPGMGCDAPWIPGAALGCAEWPPCGRFDAILWKTTGRANQDGGWEEKKHCSSTQSQTPAIKKHESEMRRKSNYLNYIGEYYFKHSNQIYFKKQE